MISKVKLFWISLVGVLVALIFLVKLDESNDIITRNEAHIKILENDYINNRDTITFLRGQLRVYMPIALKHNTK